MKPLAIYNRLYKYYGPQHWWPVSSGSGDKRFEVCLGAILTQNTSWKNVELALNNLNNKKLISVRAIAGCPARDLERQIKPSGYFRQKAKKLKIFSKYIIDNYQGSTEEFLKGGLSKKRQELMLIWGLGPETVDSILLYAAVKPIFVIDAYTKRLCSAFGINFKNYDDYRLYFEKSLPKKPKLFNEYHALIVAWGKDFKKNPVESLKIIKAPLKKGQA